MANNVDLYEVALYEPPHQDLRCLQSQLVSFLVLKELTFFRLYILCKYWYFLSFEKTNHSDIKWYSSSETLLILQFLHSCLIIDSSFVPQISLQL